MHQSPREIGEIPRIASLKRRVKSSYRLAAWGDAYLGSWFTEWTDRRRAAADEVDAVLLRGGSGVVELLGGEGKTTLAAAALLKGALEARRRFLLYLADGEERAAAVMATIQRELLTNDALLEDYPEAVYPIRSAGAVAARAKVQVYRGELTRLEWRPFSVVLPTIPGHLSSGVVIMAQSVTASLKGLYMRGRRPDCVILDDCRGDGRSIAETARRERIIEHDVPALGGPATPAAVLEFRTVER